MGGVWRRGLGYLPRKNHFVPKMMSVCILTIFNWQKKGTVTRSLGTRILWLSREKSAKIIQKIHGQTGGGCTIAPPPNMPLWWTVAKEQSFLVNLGYLDADRPWTWVFCTRDIHRSYFTSCVQITVSSFCVGYD